MDKAYFDKKEGVIKYEQGLNTVELEIDKQTIEKMPTVDIRELIKNTIKTLLLKEDKGQN